MLYEYMWCFLQTSLQQVLALFQRALHTAEKSVLQRLRITNILTTVTKLMVTYVTWGLYERHKLCFKVIVLLKLLSASGRIPPETLFVLLRGGGAMPATAVARPRPPYLSQSVCVGNPCSVLRVHWSVVVVESIIA
jgi:hypothetical protein